MAPYVKVAAVGVIGVAGYYLYQSQVTGKRADILAQQDWKRITTSGDRKAQEAQSDAQKQWNQLSSSAQQTYNSATKQVEDARVKAEEQLKNLQSDAEKNVNSIAASLKKDSDEANKKTKGWIDSATGWFSGKK